MYQSVKIKHTLIWQHYIFELKLNRSSEEVIEQINTKEYAKRFALNGLPTVKVGINFYMVSHTITDWKIE